MIVPGDIVVVAQNVTLLNAEQGDLKHVIPGPTAFVARRGDTGTVLQVAVERC